MATKSVSCREICKRHKVKRPMVLKNGKYVSVGYYVFGYKKCITCAVFMDTEARHCPCCGTMLRTAPRDRQLKERILELQPMELKCKQ